MECPKCHNEVSESDKICPHCKKVLLLECPMCHKLSRTPLCPECGFVIISKCHNCGQINPTIKGVCKKCGFSTYKSISMNEAETEEFACLAISFSNLEDLRPALKNKQIFSKFKKKLKDMIFKFAQQDDNRAQIIDGVYVIKYYKEFSFSSSTNKALKSAIALMDKVSAISYKLKKAKNIKLDCKMGILKRTFDNDNESYAQGVNIKVINTEVKKDDYTDGLLLVTDQYINTMLSRQYKLEMIYSSQVNDELLEFYEFPVKDQLTPIIDEDDNDAQSNILTKPKELPKIEDLTDEVVEIDLYSNKAIDIDTKCEFISVQGIDVPKKVQELLQSPRFITIKSTDRLQVSSKELVEAITAVNPKLLHVACHDGFVYEPYAFFKELIASYMSIDAKLANIDATARRNIASFDSNDVILNLLTHTNLENMEPQEALKTYMEVFFNFLSLQKGSVILIENLDLIDETSLEFLITLAETFADYGISIVVTVPDKYLVHKEINELLYLDAYTEITVIKTDVDRLVEAIPEDITEIQDSFYFQKIKDQCLGGTLYFNHAFQYLKDTNVFVSHEGKLLINSEKTIIFPSSLEQLIVKRFEALDESACFVLAYACYLGNNMILGILNDLEIDKLDEAITTLTEKNFITCKDFIVRVHNYRLVQKCIKDFLSDEVKQLINKNIYEKLKTKTISIIKALGLMTESRMTFYDLSNYAINHGDFNAYLRNCKRFLSILDEIPKNAYNDELKAAKNDIFMNLAKYLNKYPSHKIYAISKVIFNDCVRQKDDLKIMNISSLMLDSALLGGNYILAQQSLHQVLIRMLNPALTEGNENVLSKYFFYSCINVKILFQAGKYKQCIEALNKVITSINQELFIQLGRSNVSKDAFVNYFMSICVFGALSRVFICDDTLNQFFDKIRYMFSIDVPGKQAILLLEKLIHNEELDLNSVQIENDITSQIIIQIISAFKLFDGDYNTFAQNIYKAKLTSRGQNEQFWNLFCDLCIGFSYQKLESYVKAEVIYSDVLSMAQKTGMGCIAAIASYCMAYLKYDMHEYTNALKLINDNIAIASRAAYDNVLILLLSYILNVNIVVDQNVPEIDIEPILYKVNYGLENHKLLYLQDYIKDYAEYIESYKANMESKIADIEAKKAETQNSEVEATEESATSE